MFKAQGRWIIIKILYGLTIRKFFNYIVIFIVVIVIFIGALLISSLFPRDWIQTNIEKSCIDLKKESIPSNVLGTYFDNATDILMLNTSYSVDNNKPLESAILARVDYVPSKQQTIFY